MKYNKLLEVSEDLGYVYFHFFSNQSEKIIALPKRDSVNQIILSGTSFASLEITNVEEAKAGLSDLMRNALANHPKSLNCNINSVKLLTSPMPK